MTFEQKLSFLWHLPLRRKGWLLGCFIGSILTLPIIYVLPAKYLRHFLTHSNGNRQLCVIVTPEQLLYARQIASLMKAVANNVPWPCKCLAQAVCVNWLFKSRGILAVTYLGAKLTSQGMQAHAWVCVGPETVIGEHNDNYAVVGTFASINFSDAAKLDD